MLIMISVAAWIALVFVVARVCGFNGSDARCPVDRAK